MHNAMSMFIMVDDMHKVCVICLGAEHAQPALKGAGCLHCDKFTVRKLCSCLALFRGNGGLATALRGLGRVTVVVGITDGAGRVAWDEFIPISDFARQLRVSHARHGFSVSGWMSSSLNHPLL